MGMGRELIRDATPAPGSEEAFLAHSPERIVSDLHAATTAGSKRIRNVMLGLGALAVVGFVALVVKLIVDWGDQASWGYVAAILSYVTGISTAGPIIYIVSLFGKGYWGRALSRLSLLFVLGGITAAILLIPLTTQLPSLLAEDGLRRRTIWFEAPALTPHFWAIAGLLAVLVAGIGLLYLTSLPDLVVMRSRASGWRATLARTLSRGWVGSDVQWRSLKALSGSLAVGYLLAVCFVNLSISSDFSMSLVPGWRDAIYPVYHTITSVQLGLAGVVVALFLVRRHMGLSQYIGADNFWLLSRFMFAATLGWFYLFFSGFIVFWYGRSGSDIGTLNLTVTGPFLWAFIATVVFAFVLPWWWLIWNPVRRSIKGPVIGAGFIMVGIFFDRLRLFVPAWSVPESDINDRFLTTIPAVAGPSVLDVLVMLGALASVVVFIYLGTRALPVISIWQLLEYRLLVRPVKYLRTHGVLIAKPD